MIYTHIDDCIISYFDFTMTEEYNEEYNEYRVKAQNKIKEFIDIDEKHVEDLEIGIYNWCIDYSNINNIFPGWKNDVFLKMYNNKLISVLSNLDPNSYLQNTHLLNRLKNGEFKPHDIPFMEPYELNPDKWISILKKKRQKEQSLLNSNMEAKTDLFKCGKCKQRKCSYYEMQIRSADESATIFITCLNPACKNKWRIG